jgi:cytochrome c553
MSRVWFLSAALLALVSPTRAESPPAPELKAQAAALVKDYAGQLKTALTSAIEAKGPEGALEVCNKQAPVIAAEISQKSGWSVGRTSLKPRASAPDAYERGVMDAFEARIAKGEKAADLVSAEVLDENGQKVFRFVKAIPTAKMCLTCHGENIAPELKQKISALYPQDQATGFREGDMRGVFTLKKILTAGAK